MEPRHADSLADNNAVNTCFRRLTAVAGEVRGGLRVAGCIGVCCASSVTSGCVETTAEFLSVVIPEKSSRAMGMDTPWSALDRLAVASGNTGIRQRWRGRLARGIECRPQASNGDR